MSLYILEMKIKTALELVEHIDLVNHAEFAQQHGAAWVRKVIVDDTDSLRGVLREIINRPKEEEDRG